MNTVQNAVDGKTFAIGVLAITACMLFVGLLLVTMIPTPVYASGQSDRAGDYIMLTQELMSNQEGIVIIDAATHQMSLYAYDAPNRRLHLLQQNIPLDQFPRPQQPGGG
jgi:hypothetical protein